MGGADAAADASDTAPSEAAGGKPQAEAGAGAPNGATPSDATQGGATDGQPNLLIDEPTQGALSERPLVAKLLAVEDYKEQYHERLQQAIDGYLANDNLLLA
ncbi:hypothetical protein HMSSN139_39590 [Paenibacillus sp. HMSSN-139]|nr:hypothetical protein HMSSN139_39590 [Paenibacillus sp. HMSSN-139]